MTYNLSSGTLNRTIPTMSTHWQQSLKDVRHSGDKNQPRSTKSTDFEHVQLWRQSPLRHSQTSRRQSTFNKPATNWWQSQKSILSTLSIMLTCDFVCSVYQTQLCNMHFSTAFGRRSFSHSAPTVWNGLPLNIILSPTFDIFKCRLKTHLLGVHLWLSITTEDAVSWLTYYGKWHAYEKNKKKTTEYAHVIRVNCIIIMCMQYVMYNCTRCNV